MPERPGFTGTGSIESREKEQMKADGRKVVREHRKARWYYSIRAILAMAVSLGGLFLAKIGHGGVQLFPDSFGALSLMSIAGWAIGLGGAVAAVSIARKSKGSFVLTRETVAFVGKTEQENWEVPRSLIRGYAMIDSWLDGMMGAAQILLHAEGAAGEEMTFIIGPLPRKEAALWMKDLKRVIEGMPEKSKKNKGQYPDDDKLAGSMRTAVSQGI
jgi:hypothetical protein